MAGEEIESEWFSYVLNKTEGTDSVLMDQIHLVMTKMTWFVKARLYDDLVVC